MKRIVILGGGTGGLSVARALRFVDAEVTLVDRSDSHLFQSRLYRASVSDVRNLRVSFARLLDGQRNVRLVEGEAVYLDARKQRLILAGDTLRYDTLVVATGSRARYDREEWSGSAPSLSDIEGVRARTQESTVVVVGAGVTGVELAATVAKNRRVVLVESGPRLLLSFPERLASIAEKQITRLGVEIRREAHVVGIDGAGVRISGEQGREAVPSRAVLWAGGIQGSEFGEVLRRETGVQLDDIGRVCVRPDLTLPKFPDIFVIGDLARVERNGSPLDALATVAAQQGRYVASAIRERMTGCDARPFEYVDQGRFAIIGRGGVGVLGDTQLTGAGAWLGAKLAQKWSSPARLIYSAATASRT